jgi:sulfate permease, SulP family
LRRVTEIDSTGAQILREINAQLAQRGRHLLLSMNQPSDSARELAESGVLDVVGKARLFRDLDRAIGWAEDDLLSVEARDKQEQREMPLAETSIAAGFSAADIAALEKHVERRAYQPDQAVFQEGDPGDELFVIAKGSASAFVRLAEGGDVRLVSFGAGTVFGELAILDAGPRSATVTTADGLVCYALRRKDFAGLSHQSSATAIKLLGNLSRLLSHRLRDANRTIQQLEE